MLFLLSREHGRPAQALRKSVIRMKGHAGTSKIIMLALKNIKWERFCQNIVAGVSKNGQKNSQGRAYVAAGYNAKDAGKEGGSAEVAACRLLNHVQIENRIAELLREAQDKAIKKRRYDIETISERMALASQIAEGPQSIGTLRCRKSYR